MEIVELRRGGARTATHTHFKYFYEVTFLYPEFLSIFEGFFHGLYREFSPSYTMRTSFHWYYPPATMSPRNNYLWEIRAAGKVYPPPPMRFQYMHFYYAKIDISSNLHAGAEAIVWASNRGVKSYSAFLGYFLGSVSSHLWCVFSRPCAAAIFNCAIILLG